MLRLMACPDGKPFRLTEGRKATRGCQRRALTCNRCTRSKSRSGQKAKHATKLFLAGEAMTISPICPDKCLSISVV